MKDKANQEISNGDQVLVNIGGNTKSGTVRGFGEIGSTSIVYIQLSGSDKQESFVEVNMSDIATTHPSKRLIFHRRHKDR